MPLNILQGMLVLAAIGWAIAPIYGGVVFGAIELLLVLSVVAKSFSARRYVKSMREQLEKTLTPEGQAWVARFAMHFVWPKEAKAWGDTLKMTSLMMMFLGIWFVVRGVVTFNLQIAWALGAALAVFAIGVSLGGRLAPDLLVEEDRYKAQKPVHDEATKVLALLSTAGRWGPPSAG